MSVAVAERTTEELIADHSTDQVQPVVGVRERLSHRAHDVEHRLQTGGDHVGRRYRSAALGARTGYRPRTAS